MRMHSYQSAWTMLRSSGHFHPSLSRNILTHFIISSSSLFFHPNSIHFSPQVPARTQVRCSQSQGDAPGGRAVAKRMTRSMSSCSACSCADLSVYLLTARSALKPETLPPTPFHRTFEFTEREEVNKYYPQYYHKNDKVNPSLVSLGAHGLIRSPLSSFFLL
jgi:hypothetical protein